jgi:hypothetical protein
VHVISAMEACPTYKPWHSKQTHRTFLRLATGKCLHYYYDFIVRWGAPDETENHPQQPGYLGNVSRIACPTLRYT